VVFHFRLHSVVEREGEVLAGMFLVIVTSWRSREILEQYDLAELKREKVRVFNGTYLASEPDGLEGPENGVGVEHERVGVRGG